MVGTIDGIKITNLKNIVISGKKSDISASLVYARNSMFSGNDCNIGLIAGYAYSAQLTYTQPSSGALTATSNTSIIVSSSLAGTMNIGLMFGFASQISYSTPSISVAGEISLENKDIADLNVGGVIGFVSGTPNSLSNLNIDVNITVKNTEETNL
jgi:hypothetical protein